MIPDFPLFLYIYRPDGYHTGPETINNEAELNNNKSRIFNAVKSGVEVRITDVGEFLNFHAKNGVILYPTEEDIKKMEAENSDEPIVRE